MTHLKYQQADAPTLETIANNIRGVIQYILEGIEHAQETSPSQRAS